jgi:quinol monooxygenase YgiN
MVVSGNLSSTEVPLTVVIIQEWPNAKRDTNNYDAVTDKLRSDGKLEPDGLLLHTAGFDGDTFGILEVWESKDHHEQFLQETLMPAIQSTADQDGREPESRDYELHNFARPGA